MKTTLKITKHSASLGDGVYKINEPTKLYFYDPGFTATASVKSSITYIDGNKGQLLYRGYSVDQLANKYDYISVCYLLLFQKLPSESEASDFYQTLCCYNNLNDDLWNFLSQLPTNNHPVGNIMSAIAFASAQNYQIKDKLECMLKLVAQMPVIVASCIRRHNNLPVIKPNNKLNYVNNFLYMCFGKEKFDNAILEAMEKIFILHADHEQNASTSTVRMAGSTGTPGYAAITAGIAALWGPSHGGANEACLNMLKSIGNIDNVENYIARAKDKNDSFRLMGFGHRVYKNYDPRAKIMQTICHNVLNITHNQTPYFELALKLEEYALNDDYFISKKLYPNIDFYSGITLDAIGFNSESFTAIFALGRAVGWAAHWLEMFESDDFKISRPRQWYCGPSHKNCD